MVNKYGWLIEAFQNDDKMEFLIMISKFHQHNINAHPIIIDTASIPVSESVRN